jgi:uncharacterized protein YndB with AHSA1/START domain
VIVDGDIRLERRIDAPADVVYAYLTDGPKWARWQGIAVDAQPRPGGGYAVTMPNGQVASGYFVELVPNRRVVFTWGWVGDGALPPGSSTVEIELVAEGEQTLVRLTHRGLPPPALEIHVAGWEHYLPRLALVVTGEEAGPDALPG